ncbi:hypothetical protein LX95_02118 [Mesonia algae]|uniref:Leucine rich repeat (LRR) protein n=1 Tax=Mesonia algae TaxID=213248 RepID=A0A2W7IMB4_9FLAO|nr:hypothetical protein [Mesonia algae]PZW39753.1 hypothetical protein LX95_02118 [Mesonia algae]
MKKTVLVLSTLALVSFYACSSDDDSNSSEDIVEVYVNIPDANFKSALLENTSINTNEDEEISYAEAEAFEGNLLISNQEIEDLTGIEALKNIEVLTAFNNSISTIDLSSNTKLRQVLLESNSIENLDISMLPALEDLKVHTNDLLSLNVANGNNASFTRMEAQGNFSLACIVIDEDFTPTDGWNKDLETYYSITPCD